YQMENLLSRKTSSFLRGSKHAEAAILEVDEAALTDVVARTHPRALVLTKRFRDQLDRFAEPERVVALLREAGERMPPDGVVVANADDQLLWNAVADLRPVGFGAGLPRDRSWRTGSAKSDADAEPNTCPTCGHDLVPIRPTLAHLGPARCPSCGWRSPRPDVVARVMARAGLRAVVFVVGDQPITLPIGGIHNVYNATAALTAALALGVPQGTAVAALERFRPRFGRAEQLERGGRRLWLGLIKNPAGTGAGIRAVAEDEAVGAVVVSMNDLGADGRDVSWIWDADFDRLADMDVPVVASGRRAEDVALRL